MPDIIGLPILLADEAIKNENIGFREKLLAAKLRAGNVGILDMGEISMITVVNTLEMNQSDGSSSINSGP